jgi:hypothetical protein
MYCPIKILANEWKLHEDSLDIWYMNLEQRGYIHKFKIISELTVYELREYFISEFTERDMKPWTFVVMRANLWWSPPAVPDTIMLFFIDSTDAIYARLKL